MKLPFRKKDREPEMDLDTAQQMLNNIFDACKMEHNTVPLEVLSSYSNYRKERYALQKTVLIVMMVLFVLLPLLFIPARIILRENEESQTVTAEVSTLLPVTGITAKLNGRMVPIYEVSSHSYVLQPSSNGRVTVTATLLNRQVTAVEYDIGMVDDAAPVITGSELGEDTVCLYVSDEGSGINFDGVYVMSGEDAISDPLSCDPTTGCIVIAYPEAATDVYIPDMMGNILHLQLTPET